MTIREEWDRDSGYMGPLLLRCLYSDSSGYTFFYYTGWNFLTGFCDKTEYRKVVF